MKKVIIFIIVLIGIIYFYINNNQTIIKKDYYPSIENTKVLINNYYIYGTSFNIEGALNKQLNKNIIKNISLVLNNKQGDINIPIIYDITDRKSVV